MSSNLEEHLEFSQVECLNEDPDHTVSGVFSSDPSAYLLSDIDPQLLISVPFRTPVKVSGIKFAFRKGVDKDAIPESIKLFTNRISLGFSDAESMPSVQTISHEQIVSGEVVPLKFVLFQNVHSLQLFVDTTIGGVDKSELGKIELFGMLGENMNMKEFKKIKDDE